jgi:hypothetical protein
MTNKELNVEQLTLVSDELMDRVKSNSLGDMENHLYMSKMKKKSRKADISIIWTTG